MHYLLTALGSYGDVFPMLAIGSELRRRGHQVQVITNPHFRGEAAEAGLDFVPLSTVERYDELTRDPGLWSPVRGLGVVVQRAAIELFDELYELVSSHCRFGETTIAAHGLDIASRCFAERQGVWIASLVFAPVAIGSAQTPTRLPVGLIPDSAPGWMHRAQFGLLERLLVNRMGRGQLNELRQRVDLAPLRTSFISWYYQIAPPICLFPDWFYDPRGDCSIPAPHGALMVGFPLGDQIGNRASELNSEVAEFLDAGDPPLVFTPGSAMRRGVSFFAAAVDGCRRLGHRGILLTGYPEHLPASLPDSILAPGFTPMAKLLERSAALIHHGGIGTSARGLAAGTPQVIQPMGFDQFDNASRLRRLGVAAELPRSRFTGQALAKTLAELLDNTDVKQSCDRWAAKMDPQRPLKTACEALEQLACRDQ